MTKQILDVGQCALDHSNISQLMNAIADVEIHQAHSMQEAFQLMSEQVFDLVLVNRVLDRDGTSGQELIVKIKGDHEIPACHVMLISNFDDAQNQAIQAGAIRGFGKSTLNSAETSALILKALDND